MSRKKGSNSKNVEEGIIDGNENRDDEEMVVFNETNLAKKIDTRMAKQQKTEEKKEFENETVSIYDAAQRLKTTEPTIEMWVDHGHLEMRNGRIPIRSIKECRFNKRRFV